MKNEPCVLYAQYTIGWGRNLRNFRGCTARNERILATIQFGYGNRDAVDIALSMDGIDFPAPTNMGFTQACHWVVRQIEALGYFVIMHEEMPAINNHVLS